MMIVTQEQLEKARDELLSKVIHQQILNELDAKGIDRQFAKQRNLNFKNHAKKVAELVAHGVEPQFIDFANGIAKFKIKSSFWKKRKGQPNEYEMAIRFYNWDKFFDDPQMPFAQRINQMVNGNLGIACGCNSFKYNYGYQTFIKGSELFDNGHSQYQHDIPAQKTNPGNVGIGCIHLHRLMNPYFLRLEVIPKIAKNIFDKLPKPTGASPSATNSTRKAAKAGIKIK